MITGKRYKIAKRLGASVFEKTQGKKFALRMDTKKAKGGKFKRAGSDFGVQLIGKTESKGHLRRRRKAIQEFRSENPEQKIIQYQ